MGVSLHLHYIQKEEKEDNHIRGQLVLYFNRCEVKRELWWWWRCSGEVINPPLVSVCSPVFLDSKCVIFAHAHEKKKGQAPLRVCVACGKSRHMQDIQLCFLTSFMPCSGANMPGAERDASTDEERVPQRLSSSFHFSQWFANVDTSNTVKAGGVGRVSQNNLI